MIDVFVLFQGQDISIDSKTVDIIESEDNSTENKYNCSNTMIYALTLSSILCFIFFYVLLEFKNSYQTQKSQLTTFVKDPERYLTCDLTFENSFEQNNHASLDNIGKNTISL